jgi:hypothetical protein
MPGPIQTMRTADAQRLAGRLTSTGTARNFVEQLAEMQAECRLAAKVIRTLLRHVSPSDVFTIRDDAGAADNGKPPQ